MGVVEGVESDALKAYKENLDPLAPKMVEDAIESGSSGNNPRQATKEEIIELYKISYSQ